MGKKKQKKKNIFENDDEWSINQFEYIWSFHEDRVV